jgi:hypothetical protein
MRQALTDKCNREIDRVCRQGLPRDEEGRKIIALRKRLHRHTPATLKKQADRMESYPHVQEMIDYHYQREERAHESRPEDVISTLVNIRRADIVEILKVLMKPKVDDAGNIYYDMSLENLDKIPKEMRDGIASIVFDQKNQKFTVKMVDKIAAVRMLQRFHGLDRAQDLDDGASDDFFSTVLGEVSDVESIADDNINPRLLTVGNVPDEDRGRLWGYDNFEDEGTDDGEADADKDVVPAPPPVRKGMTYEDLFDE